MRPRTRIASAALLATLTFSTACMSSGSDDSGQSAATVLEQALQDHKAGKIQVAERLYHKVLSLDPENKFAYYNLGLIAQGADRLPLAEALYRASLTFDANYWPSLYNLALLKASSAAGRREAEILYRKVIAQNPEYAPAYLNLGLLLQTLGRSAEATAMIKKATELDPSLKSPAPSPSPAAS